MASARHSYTAAPTSDRPAKRPLASIGADTPTLRHKSARTALSPSGHIPVANSDDDCIFRSQPLHDRQSTFEALFSPTQAGRALQSHPSIAAASHKILAWRLPSAQRTLGPSRLFATGKDDDGEQHGARHALKVLDEEDVTGALVIARWYGGVMLGPVRFTHMEDVAREAVRAWKDAERGKLAEATAAEERRELVLELEARDQSIVSLRGLLDTKKSLLAAINGEDTAQVEKSPAKKMDYSGMPLARLKALDKARDGTIAFLLKGIDAAEKEILTLQEDLVGDDDDDEV